MYVRRPGSKRTAEPQEKKNPFMAEANENWIHTLRQRMFKARMTVRYVTTGVLKQAFTPDVLLLFFLFNKNRFSYDKCNSHVMIYQ
jgi:hypothetical protein